jgi:2-(1,2-epoxy-1,2-dihydrophenyl)acetyl-CoA isomerase
MSHKVKISADGDVRILTLSDPATLNAADTDMADQLSEALMAASRGPTAGRAVILTGEGRSFCSGANLNPAPDSGLQQPGEALKSHFNPLARLMRALPIPIITAVNGVAAGIGCSFALWGDLIVAAESAYFIQAFRRIGLASDGGSTFLLPRLIGKARAMEMVLLGERVSAAQAFEWGMINRCVPDAELMTSALSIAHELARGPRSLGLMREAIWAGLDADFDSQLDREAEAQLAAGDTEDFLEGLAAFREKRAPSFKGR